MALTPEQESVVNSTAKKLLVLSCAGSGKTTVIISRIMKLRERGVKPENILALTFSNKAMQEMKLRLRKEDLEFGMKTNIKTFHSFGLEIIRKYSLMIGFENVVKIAKSNDIQAILKDIFKKRKEKPIESPDLYNYFRMAKSFEPYQHNDYYDEIFEEYSKELKASSLVDMDDMIFIPVNLLSSNSIIQQLVAENYQYIFVDEYQDTNEAQNRLLDLIVNPETNICLVGDDDQAIYEWRGARPDYIRKKAESGEYKCIKLETNFRSQGEIIKNANRLINHNKKRVEKSIQPYRQTGIKPIYKKLPSQNDESSWVAAKIQELIASGRFNPSDIAILYRNNEKSDMIKLALKMRKIEYDNVELDENARYSSFINVLQAIADLSSSKDMSEALNFPTRCFDQLTFADAKTAYCDIYGDDCSFGVMEWIDRIYLSNIDFEGCTEFRERYEMITQLHMAKKWSPTQIIAYYLSYMKRKGYNTSQQDKYDYTLQAFDIAKNYEEVFENSTLKEFLDHLALSYETNDTNRSTNTDAVNVMTMHRSKGLEFKVVFVIGVQVGCIPNDFFVHSNEELEAERRLFYVAITRAKELLFLSSYKDPIGGSAKSKIIRNGFLAEITDTAADNIPTKELVKKFPPKEQIVNERVTPDDVKKVIKGIIDLAERLEGDNQNTQYITESFALSKNTKIPKNSYVSILGQFDMELSTMKAIFKANLFTKEQVQFHNYFEKGLNLVNECNDPRCLGIILGNHTNANDSTLISLKKELIAESKYPIIIDLISKQTTEKALQESILKIKWNSIKKDVN